MPVAPADTCPEGPTTAIADPDPVAPVAPVAPPEGAKYARSFHGSTPLPNFAWSVSVT